MSTYIFQVLYISSEIFLREEENVALVTQTPPNTVDLYRFPLVLLVGEDHRVKGLIVPSFKFYLLSK